MTKTNILIVDDHDVVIKGIKGGLAKLREFKVVGEAVDGRLAVEMAQSLEPDIVIMDVSMPNINGIEATKQIRHLCPEIKVIIYSMYSDKELVVDLFKAGISPPLRKTDPFLSK